MRYWLLLLLALSSAAIARGQHLSNCDMVVEDLQLGHGHRAMPAQGIPVTECHYVTEEDPFPRGMWPASTRDRITQHLGRSCYKLRTTYGLDLSANCMEIYGAAGAGCWTPAEGSRIGQAAYGRQLPPDGEMWLGTMFWRVGQRPKAGTKFIAISHKNGKAAVIAMGYEHGPRSQKWLAGISPEVAWLLGTANRNKIKLGRAVNQKLPLGPIKCTRR